MRCFVAFTLPKEVKEKVVNIQNRLRRLDLYAKWVEPENLHVTLKFLGEVGEEDVSQAKEIVASTSSFAKSFALKLADVGAFPSLRRPRVLWAGIKPMDNPVVITEYLEEAFLRIGVPKEKRSPHPHITLARIKSPKNTQNLEAEVRSFRMEVIAWEVRGVSLFKSILTPKGPIYEEIFTANLTA